MTDTIKYAGLDCILLIDDDGPTNYIHQLVIKKTGIDAHVQTVTGGREALAYLTATGKYEGVNIPQPGIIFLDINMPAMNGWEFMEEYRSLPPDKKAKIIVIMLTTSLNPDDRERALKNEEIVTFISKPLRTDKLKELVEEHYQAVT